MKPTAWRPRHDAFAAAARALRRACPQGPDPDAVAALAHALQLHLRYEEGVLWPRYAEVAPADGPGSLRALLHDHRLLQTHLAHAADPDPLRRAWALARLEGVLEHHDEREAAHVLPALEALGVAVALEEAPIPHAALREVPAPQPVAGTWPDALAALASGAEVPLPDTPSHPKALHIRQAYDDARQRLSTEATLPARREALVQAFDRALQLAWMAGQARAPWVRALSPPDAPTRPR